MIALVRFAVSRPYTVVVLALLLLIIGPLAALRTPTDIFPDIRIPVIGVRWNYTGLPPDQGACPITAPSRRALPEPVNAIAVLPDLSLSTRRSRRMADRQREM